MARRLPRKSRLKSAPKKKSTPTTRTRGRTTSSASAGAAGRESRAAPPPPSRRPSKQAPRADAPAAPASESSRPEPRPSPQAPAPTGAVARMPRGVPSFAAKGTPPPSPGGLAVEAAEGEVVPGPLEASVALTNLDATVHERLVTAYPPRDEAGAKRFTISSLHGVGRPSIQATRIFLPNLLSLYVFQAGSTYYLEIKGLSGGRIVGAESLADRTERFASVEALLARIDALAALAPRELAAPVPRPFQARDSVAVVLSESTHRALKDHVDRYLAHLRDAEGRAGSIALVVPDAIVADRNPARARDFLAGLQLGTDGLMIVGADIPPFELASTRRTPFLYATTDLPFGELGSPFWSRPIRKSDRRYAEKVYHSAANQIYRIDRPTPFTFDIDAFADTHFAGSGVPYLQRHWVTRWVGTGPSAETLARQFGAFVDARLGYRPPQRHNVLSFMGGRGLLYDPGPDTAMQEEFERAHVPLMRNLPDGSSLQTLHEVDLPGAIRRIDPQVTFLNIDEHGTEDAIGDVKRWHLGPWLPALVHLEACLTGRWAYTSLDNSIMANVLSLAHPPIAVIASQTEKGFRTMGGPDSIARAEDVFVDGWRPGQSVGSRQVESCNGYLQSWTPGSRAAAWGSGEPFLQLFASASLFGDGTAEL
jgi:hypothetical protein